MNPIQKNKFLAYFLEIKDPNQQVEALIGVLRSEKAGRGSFRLLDLLPEDVVISKQAIKDALKGRGDKLRRPGSPSDLVRRNAADILEIAPQELWPKLYK